MAWLEGEWIDGTHKFDSSHKSKKTRISSVSSCVFGWSSQSIYVETIKWIQNKYDANTKYNTIRRAHSYSMAYNTSGVSLQNPNSFHQTTPSQKVIG